MDRYTGINNRICRSVDIANWLRLRYRHQSLDWVNQRWGIDQGFKVLLNYFFCYCILNMIRTYYFNQFSKRLLTKPKLECKPMRSGLQNEYQNL